jgi:hypothetical protein
MTRLRSGWRVRVVKARRSRMLASDRIFARFPSMNKLIVMLLTHCESNNKKSNTFSIGAAESS